MELSTSYLPLASAVLVGSSAVGRGRREGKFAASRWLAQALASLVGMGGAIPGLYLAKGPEAKEWASCPSDVKRRHFVLDGQKLKLFGKRGKTYKGVINLLDVEALRPTTDATAPLGSLELQLRGSRSQATLVCIMAPDHSIDDLFMALGNAVPSHATSDDRWRLRMGSRPAPNAGSTHEYRIGKTLGSGTFGKVKLAQRVPDGKLFAIKCLNRSRIVMATQSGRLAKEIRLLKLLNHPNVIRLHEVLHTQAEIMMVMECAAAAAVVAGGGGVARRKGAN